MRNQISKENKGFRHWAVGMMVSLTGVTLFLFVFQNCAQPLDIANQDSASFNSQLPFAFDTSLDTVAYMSCSDIGNEYNSRAYFTFRAGAYGSGSGIRLTDEFLSATKTFTPSQRADSLSQSELNAGAQLQLAIRQSSEIQSMLTSSTSSVQEDRDYANILAELDSSLIAQRLVGLAAGQRINYFSGISGLSGRLLEGSLRFMDSEVSASSLRRNLLESGILTLTYLDDLQSGGTAARRPAADDRKKAFGRGYQMDFRLGFGLSGLGKVSYTKGVQRVVNSLREVDLQKRSATEISQSSWACSSETVFMIVRPEDLGKTVFCNKTLDPLAPLDKDRLALESLRRVLRPEDWWVDLDRRCIIPKQNIGSCYGNENPQQPLNIKYDGGDCIAEGKSCPHYVSICVRQ